MTNPFRISPKIWTDPATGERWWACVAFTKPQFTDDTPIMVLMSNDREFRQVPLTVIEYNNLPRITMVEVTSA